MASIVQKLETKGVIMTLLSLVLISTGCEDKIDSPAVNPSGEKTVEVTLNIGFANEADGYTIATKSDASTTKGAFSYELQPSVTTKAETSVKPDQLYNLEIVQYDGNGTYKNRTYFSGATAIGSSLTPTLTALADCQLVIIAWGEGNSTTLGTKNLSDAQKVTVEASDIESITEANMNKMPYVLHLEHVCAEGNTIKSIEGKDVRLLLKRLAARLTLNWTYSYSGYTLNQILLESIPTNYNVIASPDKTDKTYPSLLDQFTTKKIDPSGKTSYSCWIPANVRGTNSAATSQYYRIKSNAPIGSSYASFIAVNGTDAKQKLNYRVYLGGSSTFEYNIHSNTNYNYIVNFTHTGLPVNDRRVTIIDPIPASENNNNLVPTANCFMVAPGGAFCFDPFVFQQNGILIANETLKTWANNEGGIKSVKVLWQTKENGDVGDPVLGVVTSDIDHTNIVDIKNGLIYCRVAPNTAGGSGAIAAYNASGEILWSWHIWVTDYNPDARGNDDIQTPVNKRKLKFEYGSYTNILPMMDRNLGAAAGYIDFPPNELEKSKTNGFYYQWGRKDPFIGSYSNTKISTIPYTTIKTDAPTKGLLSLFKGDGITFQPTGLVKTKASYRDAYKDPGNMYKTGIESDYSWITSQTDEYKKAWGAGITKGFHDPCPAGWCVANKDSYWPLLTGTTSGAFYYPRLKNGTTVKDGGFVVYYDKDGKKTTYFYLAGYWNLNGMTGINNDMHFWGGGALDSNNNNRGEYIYVSPSAMWRFSGGNPRESLLVRCIQERE